MNQFDPLDVAQLSADTNSNPQPSLFGESDLSHGSPATRKPKSSSSSRSKRKQKTKPSTPVTGKNFILDTNVLIHDPGSISRFAENHVWIPVDVLSELDRFKNEQSERGANARQVHRHLSKVFAGAGSSVTDGVPTEGGGTLRVAVYDLGAGVKSSPALKRFHRIFPDQSRVDHRIIAATLMLQDESSIPTILVTKDLNMQLKARAVDVSCEDYLNDKVEAKDVESYGPRRVDVEPTELQRFASSGELVLTADRLGDLGVNEYVLLCAGEKKTMPGRLYADGKLRRLIVPDALHIPKGQDIRPVNLGQQCFIDALLDPTLSLVTCYGQAGTGKTLVAVAAGLHAMFNKDFGGLTVSRPVVAMGDTLGFLPGALDEKMRPWLQPIYDALELIFPPAGFSNKRKASARKNRPHAHDDGPGGQQGSGPRKAYDALIEQGLVEIEALCYIRGRSIPHRYFILDEAQQLTPLEAKTMVTRMSKGSKLVLVGDPGQIDNPYVDSLSNGLVYTRNRLRNQAVAAHVSLSKGERSDLAEIGAKLM